MEGNQYKIQEDSLSVGVGYDLERTQVSNNNQESVSTIANSTIYFGIFIIIFIIIAFLFYNKKNE